MKNHLIPANLCFNLLMLLFVSEGLSQQKYSLVVPTDPSLKSTASITGNTLTITRPTGRSYTYTRFAAYDTATHDAYFGALTRQYVRFPKSGSGNMQIGRRSGGTLTWTQSQMQASKLGGGHSGTSGSGSGTSGSGTSGSGTSGSGSSGSGGLLGTGGSTGGLTTGTSVRLSQISANGRDYLAFVDRSGKLQMYRENGSGKWEPQKLTWTQTTIPNAAIGLVAPTVQGQIPGVVSVNRKGQLFHVVNGHVSKRLVGTTSGSPTFVGGSTIAVSPNGQSCFACDSKGAIWEYGFQTRNYSVVEIRPNLVPSGGTVSALDNDLFVIDKTGNLVGYTRSGGRWGAPYLVGAGFQSGGSIASWQGAGLVAGKKAVASVNQTGNPQLYVWESSRWNPEALTVATNAGAPIGLGNRAGSMVLSFVDKTGTWQTYSKGSGGLVSGWNPSPVSTGFSSAGPLLMSPNATQAFSVNTKGQLMSARFRSNQWSLFPFRAGLGRGNLGGGGLLGRGLGGQRIISREVTPNPPLASVELILKNDHKEPIVVRVFDRRGKKKKYDVKLKQFQTTKIVVERDSGATARETYTAVGALGSVQKTRVVRIPPKVLYDVVVFENPVTSTFIDRTKKGSYYKKKPDSQSRSLRSVGVFEIPPGSETTQGTQVSAYSQAKSQKNPGAAARFGPINQ